MCIFIAVSVAGYRGDAARAFRERKLVAGPLAAEFGAPLPQDGSTLSVTDGHCACGLFAGTPGPQQFDADDERRRYQRKGWSPAKIERAIEAKRLAHTRPASANEHADAFTAAVGELATSRARVTLLASNSDSSFHVTGKMQLALGDFLASGGAFPQNTLVTIAA